MIELVQDLYPYKIQTITEEGREFYEVVDEIGRCRSIQHTYEAAEQSVRILQKYDALEYVDEIVSG